MFRNLAAFTVAFALAWAPTPARAWDGVTSGKITGVDVVTDGQNYGFRIYMDGKPMCGTSAGWAYVNRVEDNYNAMVSLLTSAYLSDRLVTIYADKNGPYCAIGYAAFR